MEKTAEEIIKKNCVFDKSDLRFASVKYYAESGSLSGSLYTAIKNSMIEYASQFKPWISVEDRDNQVSAAFDEGNKTGLAGYSMVSLHAQYMKKQYIDSLPTPPSK